MVHRSKWHRRQFLKLAGLSTAGIVLPNSRMAFAAVPSGEGTSRPAAIGADEALRLLLAGNDRFVNGQLLHPGRTPDDFRALAEGQSPMAVLLSCADSRVPPEILFDAGVGDLFVVRVAGNVVGGTGVIVKGSIEYGVAELGAPLIVVMGHSGCGAVKAAIQHIDASDPLPGAIDGLVELIKPAVVQTKGIPGDPLENAIRANVALGVERLKGLEPILAGRVKQGQVKVVGAHYDLSTGRVTLVT